MGSGPTSSPPSRKQRGRNAQQRHQNRQKMPQWGLPAEKSFRIVRKRRKGASFRLPITSNPILRPQNRRSQISSTPNSPFRPNNMPAMRPPCGISWQKRPNKTQRKVEWEIDNPFTRPQTARASFHPPDRNQNRPAHQIASGTSYVSAHPSPKHLDHKARQHSQHFEHQAFPTSPPGRKRHADATPAKSLAAYPTPCPPNLQCRSHQAFRIFQKKQPHFSM